MRVGVKAIPESSSLRFTIVFETVNYKFYCCSGICDKDKVIVLRIGVEEME